MKLTIMPPKHKRPDDWRVQAPPAKPDGRTVAQGCSGKDE